MHNGASVTPRPIFPPFTACAFPSFMHFFGRIAEKQRVNQSLKATLLTELTKTVEEETVKVFFAHCADEGKVFQRIIKGGREQERFDILVTAGTVFGSWG